MPGVPFTCVSIAVVVVCSTVCASAPVKLPEMDTVGGEISGYCATGRLIREITPTNTSTMEITIAVTGLFIKVSAIMILSGKCRFYQTCNCQKIYSTDLSAMSFRLGLILTTKGISLFLRSRWLISSRLFYLNQRTFTQVLYSFHSDLLSRLQTVFHNDVCTKRIAKYQFTL